MDAFCAIPAIEKTIHAMTNQKRTIISNLKILYYERRIEHEITRVKLESKSFGF